MVRKAIVAALLAATAVMGGSALPGLGTPAAHAITGGRAVTNGDLAFMAEIHDATGGTCSGSLIQSGWVLTAAHCVKDVPSVGDVSVRVGNTTAGTGAELRRVSRIVVHPEYTGGYNDVALLELSSPVTTVKPLPLATPSQSYLWDGKGGGGLFGPYDSGIAAGWGRTSFSAPPSPTLQFVGVSIQSLADAGGVKRIDIGPGVCQGDSGSPLLVTVNGTYMAAGVLSRAACGETGTYSEVGDGSNRDWIMGQLTKQPYTSFGLADWDRDGHQDLITRQDATGEMWVYPGISNRGYSTQPRVQIGNSFRGYTAFGVADWDRDGHQDLITRQDTTGELWIYPGISYRGYSTQSRVKLHSYMRGYTAFGIADWDRNGTQDLLVRNDSNGTLQLLPGNGARGYDENALVYLASGFNRNSSFDVTDWDRDGYQDLISRTNDKGILWLYRGDGRQAIGGASVVLGFGWQGYTSFGAADYDRDGLQDIVARQDSTTLLWLYGGQSVPGMLTTPRVQIGNGL